MRRADMSWRLPPERLAGLGFVLTLHAAALYGLWQHRLIPSPLEAATLFVNFIAPPAPEKKEEPKRPPPPKPKSIEKPQPRQIVAETPVVAPTDYVAPPPPEKPVPALVIEAPPMPLPVGPVALAAELSVACPERSAPAYPAQSRRFGETGVVVLRVELDETGRVAVARVSSSSGHVRLDDAALGAVKTWRCTPALRNGQPVRAVALQPFKFILQGN
jgi:protein TonB